MNFVCRKLDCKHNDKLTCIKDNIDIDKDLNCEMYEKDQDKKVPDTTKTMFDIVPDLAPYKHNTKCCIKCKANCIFNKNNICYSNGILINYDKKQPAICFSHLKN